VICVDASVSIKWVLTEQHSDKAITLANDATSQGEDLIAPALLSMEVANALRKQMIRQGLPLTQAVLLYQQFLTYHVDLQAPADLSEQALILAATYNLPAVYDAHYLALAQQYGCPFYTDDQRLVALSSQLSFIHWIGSYVPRSPASP